MKSRSLSKHFVDDWAHIIKTAWSVRFMLGSAAVSGLYAAWPAFQGVLPAWQFALMSVLLAVATVVARVAGQGQGAVDVG